MLHRSWRNSRCHGEVVLALSVSLLVCVCMCAVSVSFCLCLSVSPSVRPSVCLSLSLSLCVLTAIFFRWRWISVSRYQDVSILDFIDGGGGNNRRRAKLQSNPHHQQTNTELFYRSNVLPVVQPAVTKHWREILRSLADTHKLMCKSSHSQERRRSRTRAATVSKFGTVSKLHILPPAEESAWVLRSHRWQDPLLSSALYVVDQRMCAVFPKE